MNMLKSVFWEYPELAEEEHLRQVLKRCRVAAEREMYLWIMRRFLEYGRAVDALRFFSIDEVVSNLPDLRLSEYAAKKWQRVGEVYLVP